jgi:hypothetical protein
MTIAILLSALSLAAASSAQSPMVCPMHQEQGAADQHAAGVDMRGDHAMGFSHDATAHHFTLLPDGGIIEVDIKADRDDTSRDQIRAHLTHIAAMFSAGNFDVPMFIHDQVPPGVPVMKAKQTAISYLFQPTDRGGRVRIVTADPEALSAVHDFLAFQIQDHRTGDSTAVRQKP